MGVGKNYTIRIGEFYTAVDLAINIIQNQKISYMNYHIEDLNNINTADWKRLSEGSIDGTFFHTLKWKRTLEQSFNCKSHYFLLYRNEKPVALCPFYEDVIQGIRGLMPLSRSDYNHIIITDKYDPLIAYHILEKCKEIARNSRLFFILITTQSESTIDHFNRYNSLGYPIGGTMVLNLDEHNPDKIWNEILSNQDRKYIRRFEKDGFRVKKVNSIEDIKILYKYYETNLKYINAIPYPFSHFEDLLNIYSSTEMIRTLLCKNEIIAGGHLSFLDEPNKTIHLRYLSLNRNLPTRYHPTLYIEWDIIKTASEMGYRRICFGRTLPYPEDIHYKLKEKFGCQYEKEYSIIIPTSYLFKIIYPIYYNLYSLVQKYKLP
ncbi:MAG: hypothetical protein Q7J35_04345 [Candidatus Methanoperedens sp.]|nr:hypothetical protein [Candidatus Methanoperedens sp.]